MHLTTDEGSVHQDRGEPEKPTITTEMSTATTPPEPRCAKQVNQGYALKDRIDTEYWQSRRGMEPFEIGAMNSRLNGEQKRDSGPTRQKQFFFALGGQQQRAASKMQKHLSA